MFTECSIVQSKENVANVCLLNSDWILNLCLFQKKNKGNNDTRQIINEIFKILFAK